MNPIGGNLSVIHSVEEEGETLQEDKSSHNPVDPEHLNKDDALEENDDANLLSAVLLEDEDPEAAGEKEEDGKHLEESWQRHLSKNDDIEIKIKTYYDSPS